MDDQNEDIVEDSSLCVVAKYPNKSRKFLFEKINSLSSTEHEEIYRIIKEHSVNVSRNKNGVFFNLSTINDEVIEKINTFVTYCISNKDQLDEYDKRLNECKLSNKYGRIVNMNINLENFVHNEQLPECKDDWSKMKLDHNSSAKISLLILKLNEDREKLHIKRLNSKFINAKKKYSKKFATDKKFDYDHIDELSPEPYLKG